MNTKYFKIKVWCPVKYKWIPSYYYFKPGILPRTIGYMCQEDIDNLPTKNNIINKIYKAKL